jgi:glutamyl-tRNA reductase
MNKNLLVPMACASISHLKADIPTLENFRFPGEKEFLVEAGEYFKGVVLLQTCNRIEIYVQGEGEVLDRFLEENGRSGYSILEGEDVLVHLLRLASGMESMIIGEDQILGQLKSALLLSREAGTCSTVLDLSINKAIHTGTAVRKKTAINKGAVSIGSAAVLLAEELLGTLENRHILVVGVGEMGKLVAQAIAEKDLKAIYVTNRTYETAVDLADKIGGKAVKMDDLYHYISLSDVVITCTGAPHTVIHYEELKQAVEDRWPINGKIPLIMVDIAQPRDIDETAADIRGVRVFTIDDLRSVSERNLKNREKQAELAEKIISEELDNFISLINRTSADDILVDLYTWAESIRVRERDKALSRLKGADEKTRGVIEDFSKVLVKKMFSDATIAIRSCAESGDLEGAENYVHAITRGNNPCIRKDDSED